METRRVEVRDRVAQAYHDFGRFCSAHPASCLLFSILSILVLSYPAVARLRLPEISPIDVHWNEQPVFENDESAPEWLKSAQAVFVQQIVVRSGVDPWNAVNLTTEQSVRGPLSLSFEATDVLQSTDGISAACFHVPQSNELSHLPSKGCLLLSPTQFWQDLETFRSDQNVVETIFNCECGSSFCLRDVLLGIPASRSGIKKYYQTNRKRSIDYALTIFLAEYDANILNSLRKKLTESGRFALQHSTEGDERTFVHVFYRPRKYISDYLPIVSTFLVFILYLYYTARKFEMVSSRAGLAFAAGVNVAATLFMTTGLCAYLDIVPTLWAAEIFPYIILVVVTENTMIITKAVVKDTPPTLDVSSRVAHGLSQEGFSLCKYFLLELLSLLVGYSTGVSEIQEFCLLATVGLLVDFYMQLFFFAPCLTLDLLRLNVNEKQKFARMMLKSDIPHLKNFTPCRCPMRKILPRMFEEKQWKKRRLSDSQLDDREVTPQSSLLKNRRANSVSDGEEPETSLGVFGKTKSIRLALLSFVTRTRIMQRTIMIVFAVWVVWLAFVVHSKGASEHKPLFGVSHRVLESAPLAWGGWQRRTFGWWPELFSQYNMSISGHYLTFLPPIVVSSKVSPSDPLLFPLPVQSQEQVVREPTEPHELQSRINWLETQLKLYMATFFILLISTVAAFLLYTFFWDKWRQGPKPLPQESHLTPLSSYSSGFETVPTVFTGHRFPVECSVLSGGLLVSACQEGRLCLWNVETGERLAKINRLRMSTSPDGPPPLVPPQIWTIDANAATCVVGCSDGSIEVACLSRHKLIGVYQQSKIGVVHIKILGSRVALCRLDGSVDFVEISLSQEKPVRVTSISLVKSIRAHSKPISQIEATGSLLVTCSHDFTIKVFDTGTCEVIHTLLAHNAPVTSISVDESRRVCAEKGILCWWDLESAELLRSVRTGYCSPILLALCGVYIAAASSDGFIGLFDVTNGQKEVVLSSSETSLSGSRSLLAVNGEVVVSSHGHVITFWDTREKAILRQVNMGLSIDSLLRLSSNSVLCQCGNSLYKVNVPSRLSQ